MSNADLPICCVLVQQLLDKGEKINVNLQTMGARRMGTLEEIRCQKFSIAPIAQINSYDLRFRYHTGELSAALFYDSDLEQATIEKIQDHWLLTINIVFK